MRFLRVTFSILIAVIAFSSAGVAGIPDTNAYRWGSIDVPENYGQKGGRTIKIYWERLVSTLPDAPAMVLINGGPGSTHESFHNYNQGGGFEKDFFYSLREKFDLYYFDQRGNGNSNALTFKNCDQFDLSQYGTANICRDIEELRRKVIKRDKIVVFGESYGGMVALTYSVTYPESISKVIIHDSSPSCKYFTHLYQNYSNILAGLDSGEFPGIRKNFRVALEKFENNQVSFPGNLAISANDFLSRCLVFTYTFRGQSIMAQMVKEIAESGRSKVLNAILSVDQKQSQDEETSSGISPVLLAIQAQEMMDEDFAAQIAAMPAYDPWNFQWAEQSMFQTRRDFKRIAGLKGFTRYDVTGKLSRIRVPTLVIVGKYDFVCPPYYARAIQQGIGNQCRVLQVDQCAHSGFAEKHDFILPAIRSFLDGGTQSQDMAPPARLAREELDKPAKSSEIIEAYIEGTRRMQGVLKGRAR